MQLGWIDFSKEDRQKALDVINLLSETEDDETISAGIKEKRSKANIVEGILQEDVLFSSPSGAAMFVVGKSANGLTSWKNADSITLKDIESDETKCN